MTETTPATTTTTSKMITNPRGIPKAEFMENVEDFIGGPLEDSDASLKALQETLAKYRYMESNSLSRRQGLEEKIPELERTIGMIELLQSKQSAALTATEEDSKDEKRSFETSFELSDTLFVKAEITELDSVYIWLGANTMLSYSLPSAHELLSSKLKIALISLKSTKEDLIWLRESITVTEVNVARVYNWDVKRRRELREREAAQEEE